MFSCHGNEWYSKDLMRIAPDPVTFTRAAVATIGIQHTTYGYFYHAMQVGLCCDGSVAVLWGCMPPQTAWGVSGLAGSRAPCYAHMIT